MTEKELSIAEMTKECKKRKILRELHKAFVDETGVKTWEEAEEKFPDFASAEGLDQFGNPTKTINCNRYNMLQYFIY